ncbi:hypothetical protein CDV55_105140 [Aspergillus turcosus]|uniref:Uncharacterized protein n=1 Tax=Aspergillus turcosus TaxID=1245748 RepID=A0A229YXX9_9EURO|nr:hypothetical protein CDV55_105140 [Aspergillus turcosus]RLL96419.1 hypothetical protein CFD26_104455 [Aspergillus turcosus]
MRSPSSKAWCFVSLVFAIDHRLTDLTLTRLAFCQLCAVSTVGIAATGFALGRVDRPASKQGRFRRKTLLRDYRAPTADNTASPAFGTPSPDSPYFPSTASDVKLRHIGDTSHPHSDGASPEVSSGDSQSRRKSSFAGVIHRRRGHTMTSPPSRLEDDRDTSSHFRRPSSSWLRRLSIQPQESRLSNQGPSSSSSNDPASPGLSRLSSQRRVPNKLVKRPPSQHSNGLPSSAHAPSSTWAPSQLRRPATSYQRSEVLRHRAAHSLNFEPGFIIDAPSHAVEAGSSADIEGVAWQPYLRASLEGLTERLTRRLSTATRPKEQALRRILPSPDAVPALLLATSITMKEPAINITSNEFAPASPVQFRDPFKLDDPPRVRDAPSLVESNGGPSSIVLDEADPKSSEKGPSTAGSERLNSGPSVWPKRRAISTPFPELLNSKAATSDPRQSNGKRNITDPNVFRRPPDAFKAGYPNFLAGQIMRSRRSVTPSYIREYRAELGLCRDIGNRPLTSDAVALSAYQNAIFRTSDLTFPWSVRQRPKRHSIAASDPASSAIGSDDTRIFTSGDEDESDFLTDTAFDSIRTHFTIGSSSGFQGSRIETMFDKDPVESLANHEIRIEALEPRGPRMPHGLAPAVCDLEIEGEPVSGATPTVREMAELDDNEDSRVSFPPDLSDDEDAHSTVAALPGETNSPFVFPRRPLVNTNIYAESNDVRAQVHPNSSYVSDEVFTLHKLRSVSQESLGSCRKMNIFDWSEQSRNERDAPGLDERPRTVHGKNGPEFRGSRAPGRRAPNTLHLRSQSVPVSRDPTIASESRQTSGKFGTWGLGSKGVSEDWDSDFEFDDAEEDNENRRPSRTSSRRGMIVPAAILERQASLHGQFGQVQELTLLVEELKRLRHRASFLNIVQGPSSELWQEAEGIVNLATLDDEENNDSPPRSPSSLTFSFDDSEGESSNLADPSKRTSGDSWRASLSEKLPPNLNVSCDTSAKAKSVLDLIYQQRVSHDPALRSPHCSRSKKLPFDTQSLRDLVIRAGVVTRALKEVIRKEEGVITTPGDKTQSSNPPFSRIFDQPSDDNHLIYETHCVN